MAAGNKLGNLVTTLAERQNKIDSGMKLLRQTREMYDQYAQAVFTTTYDRFAELEKSLNAKELRMAVIGEFSRGKSSLLNALLGIRQLPTAQEATTAINTFIYGLSANENNSYLDIVFKDGKIKHIDIADNDQEALRKWGTELEAENRDARNEVDHIDYHLRHELLDLGLVLIDTPGLESMQAHHEEITHRAIDSAHIAIWVQATTQLGGNKREWEFLKETIRKSFRKFITVINWWDKVLEPDDEQDKTLDTASRVKAKLRTVRTRFREVLGDMPKDKLDILTNEQNLFGISARWALAGTDEQKKASGIDKLASRINEICASPDSLNEIFYKPMRQLSDLQNRLKEHLEEGLAAFQNTDSLEKQRQDIELLQSDIKNVESELKVINSDAQIGHQRLADKSITEIKTELVEPIQELKLDIDKYVTPAYVKKCIDAKQINIGLPGDLQERFDEITGQLNLKMDNQRQKVKERLEQLRLDYAKEMEKYMDEMAGSFSSLNISMPKLDISCNLDFGSIESFYADKMALENELESKRQEIDDLEKGIIENAANEAQMAAAREAVLRAEKRILSHGSAPSPIVRERSYKISDGGMYSSPKYGTETVVDRSNVEEWEKQHAQLMKMQEDKEREYQRIIEAEQAKSGRRMSMEQAKRKYERAVEKLKEQLRQKEAAAAQAKGEMQKGIYERLLRNTSGQLDSYIRLLENTASEGIRSIFDNHLKFLGECVTTQYTEVLRGKESAKNAALDALKQGEQEKNACMARLGDALERLNTLHVETEKFLEAEANGL